jgi:very-short-patch-repair endonuclease
MTDATPQNNFSYNKELTPVAHKLRSEMTKAEACLWKYVLKAGQLKGCQFRRQRPVLNYVADFMCKELMLVIEVDGITHAEPEAIKRDEVRQKAIESAGFTVLRFLDNDVLHNLKGVHLFLENWIEDFEKANPGLKLHRDKKRS